MNAFEPYLAEDRLRAMARGEELDEVQEGAVLFADVCGFSAHGEALVAALGEREGAERLAADLASVYDVILPIAREHGGAVVAFNGDAVTCWFRGETARPAVRAAHAMQAALGARGPGLLVKVAVAAGRTRRVAAGSPEVQRLDLLVGGTMDRMAAAERHAREGEVVVSEEVAAALRDEIEVAEVRGGSFTVVRARASPAAPAGERAWTQGPVDAHRIRAWLPPDVHQRLLSGQGDFLAEFRRVTTLFLGFGGLDYDGDDAVRDKLDALVREVQRILTRAGGHLVKLTTGDKGSYLLGVFGAPVTREDGPRHALAAALELRALGSALDFVRDVRIGMSLGRLLTGAFGSRERRAYDVLGSEANIAARLMQVASPGEVWVTPRVRNACPDFAFEERGRIQLKGRLPPLDAAALVGRSSGRSRSLSGALHDARVILGRNEELARIEARLRACADSKGGGVLVIEGEAGIGKTRLAEELRERASALGIRVLTGAADSIEQHTPYRALGEPFEQLVWGGAERSPGATDLEARVKGLLGHTGDVELLPLLSGVIGVDMPDNARTAPMVGPSRSDSTQHLLARMLAAVTQRGPVVLLVEDSHWLDSASWGVLLHVRRTVPALLVVLVTRPPPRSDPDGRWRALAQIGGGAGADWLRLPPLSHDQTVALACAKLGVASLPDAMAHLVAERAGGHPLFGQELAVALRDRGAVVVEGGRCKLVGEESELAIAVPFDSVEEAITSRIDALGPAEQLALKVASVVGREFSLEALQGVHPVRADRPRIPELLETAVSLGITHSSGEGHDRAYTFAHAITQEVVYALLPKEQRQDLHRAVGEHLEKGPGADITRRSPLLAHHFGRAGAPARAVPYLEKAGDQARRAHANREVVRFFTEALAADDEARVADSVTRARWQRILGEALLDLGRFPESRDRLLASARSLEMSPPPRGAALGRSLAASAARQVLHRAFPTLFVGREHEKRGQLLEAARIELGQAKLHFYLNEGPEFIGASLRAMNIAERAGTSTELALAYSANGVVAGVVPLRSTAATYCQLALSAAAESGDVAAEARVLVTVAVYDVGIGNFRVAFERVRRARELFERLGDRRQWEETLAVEAPPALHAGAPGEAEAIVLRLHASAKLRNDPHTLSWGLLGRAEVGLRLEGDAHLPEVLEHVTEVESLFDRDLGPVEELRTHAVGALTRLRLGDTRAAEASADRALALVKLHRPVSPHTLEGHASVATTFLGLWQREREQSEARARWEGRALASVGALSAYARVFPIARPRFLLCSGLAHHLRGHPVRARRAFRAALRAADALGMAYDADLARRELEG